MHLEADFEGPPRWALVWAPTPGVTLEPLLCGRYWGYARGPPFPGIMKHNTLVSPTWGTRALELGGGMLHPCWGPGRS